MGSGLLCCLHFSFGKREENTEAVVEVLFNHFLLLPTQCILQKKNSKNRKKLR